MTHLPPLRSVQAFEAVARCGSVAGAAEEIGVSPAAISQQTHSLESFLEVQLFERRGRVLELTLWGRMYYERVRIAFDELRAAQKALSSARRKSGIVLSSQPSLALTWLQSLVMEWHAQRPDAGVQLIGTEEETTLPDSQIDFRLSYGTDVRRYDHFVELFVDSVVPVCSSAFLRKYPVRTASDILAGPLIDIVWNDQFQQPPSWADWARSVDLPPPLPKTKLAFSLSSSAIDAAISDGGFVLGQLSMIAEHVNRGRLVIPLNRRLRLPAPYFLAWDRAALDRPFGAEFRSYLTTAGRRMAADGGNDQQP